MSYVIADPEMMTAAAGDLAAIGLNVNAAHMAAAAPTVAVIPAAADEVSTGIAHLFSQHAANYQALAGQAAAFNDQFVQTLNSGLAALTYTEANSAVGLSLLFSLLPPGIQNELQTALDDLVSLAELLILGIVVGAIVSAFLLLILYGILVTSGPGILMHPLQFLQAFGL
jgi:hypothetical protein